MKTTIKISKDLQKELKKRKTYKKDSYEGVIWDLIERTMELSKETKLAIKKARKDIKEGKFISLEEVKKKLNIQ